MPRYQTPTGMHDLLAEDLRWYEMIERAAATLADAYGFGRIETPALEAEEVFTRGVGLSTDIVEKEMYTLRTRGGDRLALRPEGTAPIVRAYLQHGMRNWPQPVRLWYFSRMFRHERPQAGRLRQFWQAGFEIIGEDDVVADAESVLVTMATLDALGLKDLSLQVNSIGCSQCRPLYRKAFVAYLRPRQGGMCGNCRKRLKASPLRTLDCKDERCQRVLQGAPEFIDHLCEPCRVNLRMFLEFLEELQIPYLLNSRLVRGLDYYSRTVFEIWSEQSASGAAEHGGDEEGSKEPVRVPQQALAAGGRYDTLFRALGGKPTGAVGSALGVERIIAAMRAADIHPPEPAALQVFLVQLGEQAKRKAPALFEELRREKFRIRASFGRDSIKSQLRIADKLGATYVLILGQKEVSDDTVILRSMASGAQETVKRGSLIPILRNRLQKAEQRQGRGH
ncbi:MAG: histidine--tRNA ligase [Candidatus Terrybacteria bacterium]|nr:histidine--tRNA ligase [Candidatus Terrybacteria bacterium]